MHASCKPPQAPHLILLIIFCLTCGNGRWRQAPSIDPGICMSELLALGSPGHSSRGPDGVLHHETCSHLDVAATFDESIQIAQVRNRYLIGS